MDRSPFSSNATDSTPADCRTQEPGLREKMQHLLREQGWPVERVRRHVAWCQDFILYNQRRMPQEMGALEVEQYLCHLRDTQGGAIEEARQALTILYREIMGRAEALQPRLLERVRAVLRVRHYALRTEECYVQWIKRFILFHHKRHPAEMGAAEVQEYLTHLAIKGHVSASTQTQALNALVFLYKQVLEMEVGNLNAVRVNSDN